jgi:hypothetical protein
VTKSVFYILFFICFSALTAQNKIALTADFNVAQKQISVSQTITYFNTTNDTLSTIYLTDWNNSYSSKYTALGERFAEEYDASFHFAKNEDRGYTSVISIQNDGKESLEFERLKDQIDIIKVKLVRPLLPQESYTLLLNYNLLIPNSRFTQYGVTILNEYKLKYWYITPAVYDGKWHLFSNKNIDDSYIPKADVSITLNYPNNYYVLSELDELSTQTKTRELKTTELFGKDRVDTRLFLLTSPSMKVTQTNKFKLLYNIIETELNAEVKMELTKKIATFIEDNFGEYPHNKLMVTEIDVTKNPIYGLNQLPNFIRPFPENFHFELKLLKNAIGNYLTNVLLVNPRKDQWLQDGIETYYLMKYIEQEYPNTKLLGKLADIWGIRAFHAADLEFNEQYRLFYTHMSRTNRDQSLTTSKDSLTKFNNNLGNKAKAGIGLMYLEDFIGDKSFQNHIKTFLKSHQLQPISTKDFENYIKSSTSKDINWFFQDYLKTNKKIDYKIKKVRKTKDSVSFIIKNKKRNTMPIPLYTLQNDSVVSRIWLTNLSDTREFKLSREFLNRIDLNYEKTVPELNSRNNSAKLKNYFFGKKPLQVRLLKDFEDPNYNQLFVMPILEFRNIYDGVTMGAKFYNKTILRKPIIYAISPLYSLNSKRVTGNANLIYIQDLRDKDMYKITYGISFAFRSYAPDLFARQFTPYMTLHFRDNDHFRSKKYQALNFRYIDINRDKDTDNILATDEPNYGVFNIRYINTDPHLINFYKWYADFQLSDKFGKISLNYEYRRLFENNRQLNLRFFAGTFLYNNNPEDNDYFSFALDRPTDYLFDYNYLGRAETTGLVSQQIIIAEGGFKSVLDPAFANQWMSTINLSTTIWNYVQAYGDIGLVKNKNQPAHFVYDSGIRLNLVTDFFEIYFPVYSKFGLGNCTRQL